MKMKSYFLKTLLERKLRSSLLVLSVMVCVFLVATVDGMLSHMRSGFMGELGRYMGKISIQQKGSGYPPFDSNISSDTYEEISGWSEINIEQTTPIIMGVVEPTDNPMDFAKVFAIGLIPGREDAYLSGISAQAGDVSLENKAENSVVLGSEVADSFSSPGIGDKIEVLGRMLEVTGILKKTEQSNVDQAMIIPLDYVQQMFGKPSGVTSVLVTLNDPGQADQVSLMLEENFPEYEIVTQNDIRGRIDEIMSLPNRFMGMISWTVFAVAIVIITNIMLISVSERRKEIGILRAIGFQRTQVMGGIVFESFLFSFAGGICGFVLAIPAAQLMGWNLIMSPAETLKILIIIILIGTFSGVYPAIRATGVQPVEAISYE